MNKKNYQIAKMLFKGSIKGGSADASLVKKVLGYVLHLKPHGLLKILKIYKNLISQALAKEELTIEAATIPSLDKSAFLKKTAAKRIILKKNPGIVFGAKITHGDWIWEETLDSKLNQIKSS